MTLRLRIRTPLGSLKLDLGDNIGPAPEEPDARELFVLSAEVEEDREEVDELLAHLSDEYGFGWSQ